MEFFKHRNGLIGTIIFHVALLLFMLFAAFRTPLPLPEERGILVDFGTARTGQGAVEPRLSQPAAAPEPVRPQKTQPQPAKEQIETQDNEETVAIPVTKPKPKPKEKPVEKPAEKPKETPTETTQPAQPVQPERTVNQRALYPGRGEASSTSTSQGEAGGSGNQGSPTGQVGVHVYGDGSGWSIDGRSLRGDRLPAVDYKWNENNKIVVEVTVDKEGNVISAEAGVRGSTTNDASLLAAVQKAAMKAKFTRKPDAPVQKGTITYVLKMKE